MPKKKTLYHITGFGEIFPFLKGSSIFLFTESSNLNSSRPVFSFSSARRFLSNIQAKRNHNFMEIPENVIPVGGTSEKY